jgi:hypothetical protein
MARGWESKAVEEQQLDRDRPRASSSPSAPVNPEREQRRRTLELARARAVDDLSRARNAAHQTMLERTIAAIDDQLREA